MSKIFYTAIFLLAFTFINPNASVAQTSKYKCMIQMTNYMGEGAYVVISLIDSKGAYDKTLYVFLPGQPEYELVPLGKDKFGIKVLNNYFVQFAVNEDRKVPELVFIQPNGNFPAKRK